MANNFKKAMVLLGFSPENEEEFEENTSQTAGSVSRYSDQQAEIQERESQVTPLRQRQSVSSVQAEPLETPLQRITTIHPRSYNDAKSVGESFRDGIPVIMNLSDMDDANAKRMVDFSAGLVFGLHGAIERVTSKVFLLSPEHVAVEGDVAGEDGAFYNQS